MREASKRSSGGSDLFSQYRPLALAIAREFYWQGADYDDVRQEALTALLEAERSWRRIGSFPVFARVVIKRRLIDCLRAAGRRPKIVCGLNEERDGLVLDFEAYIENRARIRAAIDAHGKLSPRQRHVLARTVQGHSYAEIADELDLSPSVVKWAAWKARSLLRACEAAA